MNCPKCLETMKPVAFEGIEVDRCRRCGGLFFDAIKLQSLLPLVGSKRIDTVRPSTSRELDCIPHILCPRCLEHGIEIKMIALVDRAGLKFVLNIARIAVVPTWMWVSITS